MLVIDDAYVPFEFENDNIAPAFRKAAAFARTWGGGRIYHGDNDGHGHGSYWVILDTDPAGQQLAETLGLEQVA